MVSLRLQVRLAKSILSCGRRRVWLDPNESSDIAMAHSRAQVRRLVRDGFIIKKPVRVHTRFRARRRLEQKRKGRHTGPGKRRGTRESRCPSKKLWIRRSRILRRLLKKFRASKKIDKHTYRVLYKKCKGGAYRNKRTLTEAVFRIATVKAREKALADELAVKKQQEVDRLDHLRKTKEKQRVKQATKKRAKEDEERAAKEAAERAKKSKKAPAAKPAAKAAAKTSEKAKKEETKPAKKATKEEVKPAKKAAGKKEEAKPAKAKVPEKAPASKKK